MKYVKRAIEDEVLQKLRDLHKVIVIYGTRRVGKTELLYQVIKHYGQDATLLLNGEDVEHAEMLAVRSSSAYKRLLGNKSLLVIDEAQAISGIGLKLKVLIDSQPNLKILVSGSSSFDLNNEVGEPLVGRKLEYFLFPLAQKELSAQEDYLTTRSNLEERMIFGTYPELYSMTDRKEKIQYIKDLVNAYLMKDILAYEGIKKRDLVVNLLKLIAFRVGSEISLESIGRDLQISKNTVSRYLDLLSKVFIIYQVQGFSRNLDNEVTKKSKWYFFDNGIRNALISNFNPISTRDDVGKLWENYFLSERVKYQSYSKIYVDNYFWRHKSQQELDWVEVNGDSLDAYELKWTQRKVKIPPQWGKAYPNSRFQVVDKDNYLDYILD